MFKRRLRLLLHSCLIGIIITTLCLAKTDKPELWEEVYSEGKTIWCVDINHLVCSAGNGCYFFLVREYHPSKGYKIYSCDWWPNLNSLSWALRWKGSENTDKRAAIPVEPKYFYNNTADNSILGTRIPLKPWQEAVTRYVTDEVMLHPDFVTFIDSIDDAPLLPNYPYANGRRR